MTRIVGLAVTRDSGAGELSHGDSLSEPRHWQSGPARGRTRIGTSESGPVGRSRDSDPPPRPSPSRPARADSAQSRSRSRAGDRASGRRRYGKGG